MRRNVFDPLRIR